MSTMSAATMRRLVVGGRTLRVLQSAPLAGQRVPLARSVWTTTVPSSHRAIVVVPFRHAAADLSRHERLFSKSISRSYSEIPPKGSRRSSTTSNGSSSDARTSHSDEWSLLEFAMLTLFAVGATASFALGSRMGEKPVAVNSPSTRTKRRENEEVSVDSVATRATDLTDVVVVNSINDILISTGTTETPSSSALASSFPEKYTPSASALRGDRRTMEDEYFVSDNGRFVAVFDGHGGSGVSSLLRDSLYPAFQQALHQQSNGNNSHGDALTAALQYVDQQALQDDSLQFQGSTAVAVSIKEEETRGNSLVVAHVGDSRAVLSRDGRAVDLTRDHTPHVPSERVRIANMGGQIVCDSYDKVCRVNSLAISRSIGDRFAKPAVSGKPHVIQVPIQSTDNFCVLASDGLWDVMSSQQVVDYIHDQIVNNSKGRQEMSHLVAHEALKRGSDDNVCVAIVWLQDEDQ